MPSDHTSDDQRSHNDRNTARREAADAVIAHAEAMDEQRRQAAIEDAKRNECGCADEIAALQEHVTKIEMENNALRAEFEAMTKLHDAKHRDWQQSEAEVERMWPVVEAAEVFAYAHRHDYVFIIPALKDAVDAYRDRG